MCAFVEGRSKSSNGLVRNRTLNLKRKKVNASNYESLLDCTKTYFSRAGFYRHFYMRRISDSKKRMLANEDCDSYATNRLPCALYLCFLQYMLTCLRNKILIYTGWSKNSLTVGRSSFYTCTIFLKRSLLIPYLYIRIYLTCGLPHS